MKKVNWEYYFARKFSLQRYEVVMNVFVSDFWRNEFGVHEVNQLTKPSEGKNHEIWMDGNSWSESQQKVFDTVYKDLDSWQRYKRIIKETQETWLDATKEINEEVSEKLSNQELGKLFEKYIFHHQEHFNKPIWICFATEPLVAEEVEKILQRVLKRVEKENEFNKWFEIIFTPEEKNSVSVMQEELLVLAIDVKESKKDYLEELKGITEEFGFIPCYDVIDAPWDYDYFEKELRIFLKKDLNTLVSELDELSKRPAEAKQNFADFLASIEMKQEEKELFIMAHDLIFIKDERDDYRRRGSCLGRPLFEEIGRRLGISGKEVAYLSIEETKNFLKKGIRPNIYEIKKRAKGFLLMFKGEPKLQIASGGKIKQIVKQELGDRIMRQVSRLHGVAASKGKICGPVVIVRTRHDLRRVELGSIMVAVTTNPDFVPTMKRCIGIVTDEGGVTSHAAIVSREMGVPCVAGTKLGTKVFKDGDSIEIDAETGVVRKL